MIELLKELQENVETTNNDTWRVIIAGDESGELLLDEVPVAIFDNLTELKTYTDVLLESESTLTIALIAELIDGVKL